MKFNWAKKSSVEQADPAFTQAGEWGGYYYQLVDPPVVQTYNAPGVYAFALPVMATFATFDHMLVLMQNTGNVQIAAGVVVPFNINLSWAGPTHYAHVLPGPTWLELTGGTQLLFNSGVLDGLLVHTLTPPANQFTVTVNDLTGGFGAQVDDLTVSVNAIIYVRNGYDVMDYS